MSTAHWPRVYLCVFLTTMATLLLELSLTALGEADLKKARALLRSGDYTKVQIANELRVSRHTLWRAML